MDKTHTTFEISVEKLESRRLIDQYSLFSHYCRKKKNILAFLLKYQKCFAGIHVSFIQNMEPKKNNNNNNFIPRIGSCYRSRQLPYVVLWMKYCSIASGPRVKNGDPSTLIKKLLFQPKSLLQIEEFPLILPQSSGVSIHTLFHLVQQANNRRRLCGRSLNRKAIGMRE